MLWKRWESEINTVKGHCPSLRITYKLEKDRAMVKLTLWSQDSDKTTYTSLRLEECMRIRPESEQYCRAKEVWCTSNSFIWKIKVWSILAKLKHQKMKGYSRINRRQTRPNSTLCCRGIEISWVLLLGGEQTNKYIGRYIYYTRYPHWAIIR